MNGYEKIGQRIRYYRAQRRYGKQEFARLLEITLERLDEIENGKPNISLKHWKRLHQRWV